MEIGNVLKYLGDGQAAKRASWGGYIKKDVTNPATGAYTLTWVKRDGTSSVYTFNGSTWSAPGSPLGLDAELQASLLADDWQVGSAASFELARSGSGTW